MEHAGEADGKPDHAHDHDLPDRSFWQEYWQDASLSAPDSLFHATLWRVLPHGEPLRFLEIGCTPGRGLVYFARRFGYRVTGLDYARLDLARATLDRFGVEGDLIEADFTTYESGDRYDVVASFGVLEHFPDPDRAIRRQAALVARGGYLVVEMPNLRYANGVLYRLFAPALLRSHNLAAMDLGRLRAALGPEFEVLHARYAFTCALFFDAANPLVARRPLVRTLVQALRWPLAHLGLDDIPSRFFSPYMMLIARRRPDAPGGADGTDQSGKERASGGRGGTSTR